MISLNIVVLTQLASPFFRNSNSWSQYNYKNNVDISMGLCNGMLQALGPFLMAIHGEPRDPNVDPDTDGDFLTGEEGPIASPEFIPGYIRSVRV